MTARLSDKRGYWQVVIDWTDEDHNRHRKTKSTGLKVADNTKRKAEQIMRELLNEYEQKISVNSTDILFSDYLIEWLDIVKLSVSANTFFNYKSTIENVIVPYFQKKSIRLYDLKPFQIQSFYGFKMQNDGVTGNTIKHYHANIHKALSYAVKMGRIKNNPADMVELPKIEKFFPQYYTQDELKQLIHTVQGHELEPVIYLASKFGLRRGEIIGLRWSRIDLEKGILSIDGVVRDKGSSGSKIKNMRWEPNAKTASSLRSFPLSDVTITYLKQLKETQNRKRQEKGYNHEWDDFVCVRSNGDLIPLEYVSRTFPVLCEQAGLKRIRFHDLRHTNISLLLEQGATMKELQEWAGHSSYSTTANIYAHIQPKTKEKLTAAIDELLG